jgi:short-subunit dehydrogenase
MSLPTPDPSARVLVTGASSGIGTELARCLAERGHSLAITARRQDRLEALADELEVQVDVHPCDLGDPAARDALVAELLDGPPVTGVCNCAGFGTAGEFLDLDAQRELDQLALNIDAVLALTHAFAGPMVERGEGAILNVASIAAFQPLPGMATYSATKAFVQTFSEAVHEELRGTGVSCTVLCPGPVETEWATIAGAQSVMIGPAKVSPRAVAVAAVEGMESGKRSVVPGIVPKAASLGGRYAPRTLLLPGIHRLVTRRT